MTLRMSNVCFTLHSRSTLGGDLSGFVEAVSSDVNDFNVGDEVYGQASVLMGGRLIGARFCER